MIGVIAPLRQASALPSQAAMERLRSVAGHLGRPTAAAASPLEVVLAMVPIGHRSLPLLEAAVAAAGCALVQVQTADDIPSPCFARGMVVVHNQGGTLAGTLDTDTELRRAMEPGVLPALQWVHTLSAGVDHLPHHLFATHDPPITCTHNQASPPAPYSHIY